MKFNDTFDADDWPRFIHLDLFDAEWAALKLDDNALNILQADIKADPSRHPMMSGTQGLRKIRFAEPGANRGKRGSYRVGYIYFPEHGTILLVTVWGKGEKANLSKEDRNAVSRVVLRIKEKLDRGEI